MQKKKKQLLSGLSIRTGAVRNSDIGYILACDPALEADDILHTKVLKWHNGKTEEGSLNFSAHTCCLISVPGLALVKLAGFGEFGISTPNGNFAGNIYNGQHERLQRGAIRTVVEIDGRAYAAGLRGIVFRLDDFVTWEPMDKGLPVNINLEAIDGFSAEDIYVVGDAGEVWHYNGHKWEHCDLPTNVNFHAVKCAGDGNVYIAGANGHLLSGRKDTWSFIAEDETNENFWDIEWFAGELYFATISFVYRLNNGQLDLVDFGSNTPDTCYHLSAAQGVMWSIGAQDIIQFDGKNWERII